MSNPSAPAATTATGLTVGVAPVDHPDASAPPPGILDQFAAFLVAEIAALPKTESSSQSFAYTGQATGVAPFYVARRPEPRDAVLISRHPNSVDAAVMQKVDVMGVAQGLAVRFYAQLPADLRATLAGLINRFAADQTQEVFQAADFIRMSSI